MLSGKGPRHTKLTVPMGIRWLCEKDEGEYVGVGGSNVGVATREPESCRLSSDTDLSDRGVAGAWRGSSERYEPAEWNECELEAESGMKPSFDNTEGRGEGPLNE